MKFWSKFYCFHLKNAFGSVVCEMTAIFPGLNVLTPLEWHLHAYLCQGNISNLQRDLVRQGYSRSFTKMQTSNVIVFHAMLICWRTIHPFKYLEWEIQNTYRSKITKLSDFLNKEVTSTSWIFFWKTLCFDLQVMRSVIDLHSSQAEILTFWGMPTYPVAFLIDIIW